MLASLQTGAEDGLVAEETQHVDPALLQAAGADQEHRVVVVQRRAGMTTALGWLPAEMSTRQNMPGCSAGCSPGRKESQGRGTSTTSVRVRVWLSSPASQRTTLPCQT